MMPEQHREENKGDLSKKCYRRRLRGTYLLDVRGDLPEVGQPKNSEIRLSWNYVR